MAALSDADLFQSRFLQRGVLGPCTYSYFEPSILELIDTKVYEP